MFLVKFLVLFAVLCIQVAAIKSHRFENLAQLVAELIEYERVPSSLCVISCWPKMEDLKLARRISVPVQFVKSSASINLPISDDANKQWFFVDMVCKESSNFLSKIDEKYFAHPYRWIIADAVFNSIQNQAFLPGSNIILANHEEDSTTQYTLKQGECNAYSTESRLIGNS